MNSLREMSGVAARGRDKGLCEEWWSLHDGGWRKAEQKQDFSSALKYLLLNFMTLLHFFSLIFSSWWAHAPPLLLPPAAICEQSTFSAPSLICVISWRQHNCMPLVSISFWFRTTSNASLCVCLCSCTHPSPTRLQPWLRVRASASSARCHPQQLHATQATSSLQTPKLCPNYYYFSFFPCVAIYFFFMKKMADFFYRKKKMLWEVPFLERKQCFWNFFFF